MKRKIISLALVTLMLIGFLGSNIKASSSIEIIMDGKKIESDVAPIVKDGRTLVPVRVISEELGLDVKWNNGEVIISNKDSSELRRIVMELNSKEVIYNKPGYEIELDVAPILHKSRTLVPLRFIGELMGMDVDYTNKTNSSPQVILKQTDKDNFFNIKKKAVNLSGENNMKYENLNDLAFKWVEEIFKKSGKDENIVISPLGLNRTLTLLLEGIDESERTDVMNFLIINSQMDNEYSDTISKSLILLNDKMGLTPTEALNDLDIFKIVGFPKEATKEKIDLQEEVFERVLNANELDKDIAMALMDATKYKSSWAESFKFDKEKTVKEDFTNSKGSKVQVDMMKNTLETNAYKGEKGEVIALTSSSDYPSKVYFLKAKDNNINSVKELLEAYKNDSKKYIVNLSLPKIEFESSVDKLEDLLENIGLPRGFKDAFRLKKYIQENEEFYISSFTQDSYLKVDEEGAEALAYTEMTLRLTSMPMEKPEKIDMNFNSPYYIVIEDRAESETEYIEDIIFIGYVADPSQK